MRKCAWEAAAGHMCMAQLPASCSLQHHLSLHDKLRSTTVNPEQLMGCVWL